MLLQIAMKRTEGFQALGRGEKRKSSVQDYDKTSSIAMHGSRGDSMAFWSLAYLLAGIFSRCLVLAWVWNDGGAIGHLVYVAVYRIYIITSRYLLPTQENGKAWHACIQDEVR